MQKQRVAKPSSGFGVTAMESQEVRVPDVAAVLAQVETAFRSGNPETIRKLATSHDGVPGRWKARPCGFYDCPRAEFIPD